MSTARLNNILFSIFLILSVGALFATSAASLVNLPEYWSKEEYSHGFLIPLIAVFLGWHDLSREKPEIAPSWIGVSVLVFGLLLSILSELVAFEALLNYSFIVALFGISLGFFGRQYTRVITPALVFLLFAAPLPHIIYGNLSVQMQLISSSLGEEVIRLFGFSVYREGNVIDLGYIKLQVVEACNGLRYLFPLMSLGYLVAYLMEDKWWKRALVFLSTVPVTIVMNSLRIVLIGVTVNLWGKEMAEGVLHSFEGYVVFGICLLILLGEVWLFLRFSSNGRFRDEYIRLPKGKLITGRVKIASPVILSVFITLGGAIFFHSGIIKNRTENTPTIQSFSTFPVNIDGWRGTEGALTQEEIGILDLTDYWKADYMNELVSTSPVNLYIAYYASQRMRANIHVPLNCIAGSGWEVASQSSSVVYLPDQDIPVVRLIIKKQDDTRLVYYWLDQRGRQMNSILMAKLYLALDSMTRQRTDGALVRLTTPVKKNETHEDADRRLEMFMKSVFPLIKQYIPGKKLPPAN